MIELGAKLDIKSKKAYKLEGWKEEKEEVPLFTIAYKKGCLQLLHSLMEQKSNKDANNSFIDMIRDSMCMNELMY